MCPTNQNNPSQTLVYDQPKESYALNSDVFSSQCRLTLLWASTILKDNLTRPVV